MAVGTSRGAVRLRQRLRVEEGGQAVVRDAQHPARVHHAVARREAAVQAQRGRVQVAHALHQVREQRQAERPVQLDVVRHQHVL